MDRRAASKRRHWLAAAIASGLAVLFAAWLWSLPDADIDAADAIARAPAPAEAPRPAVLPDPRTPAVAPPALPGPRVDAVAPLPPTAEPSADGRAGPAPAPGRALLVLAFTTGGIPLLGAIPADALVVQHALDIVAWPEPPPAGFAKSLFDLPPSGAVGEWTPRSRRTRASWPAGCMGELALPEGAPAWVCLVLRHRVVASRRVEPGDEELRFEVDLAALLALRSEVRLKVVAAEDGQPLPGAKVGVDAAVLHPANAAERTEDGTFQLRGLLPGMLMLDVQDEGREHLRLKIDAPEGRGLDLGVVSLAQEVVLTGRVVDAEGEPLVGRVAAVPLPRVTRFDLQDLLLAMMDGIETDEAGGFTLGGLSRARYVFVAVVHDSDAVARSAWELVELGADDAPRSLELRCPPATTVRFSGWPAGARAPAFSLSRAEDGLRLDVHGEFLGWSADWDIPQGRYTLSVHEGAGRGLTRVLEVGPGTREVRLVR